MIKKHYKKSGKLILSGFLVMIAYGLAEAGVPISEGHPLYELGSLLYLFGAVMVWMGFYHYVKSKGRHGAWTLTLVTGFIGMIIMGSLKDLSREVISPKNEDIEHVDRSTKKAKHLALSPILWGIIIGIGVTYFVLSNRTNEGFFASNTAKETVQSSVVNIICPFVGEEFSLDAESSSGSGTVFSEGGEILTNEHIYPQNDTEYLFHEKGCFIIFPDAKTGLPEEIYLAEPYIVPNLGLIYDLAYLVVYDAYTDELGETYGTYPRSFPSAAELSLCYMKDLALGDPVLVLGYPSLTGGLNLTLTEGIVSSFDEEGFILTSAQVTEGNSGGLAMTKDNCMIGIPSLYLFEERHEIGGIISVDSIMEFIELASDPVYLEELSKAVDELSLALEAESPCGANAVYSEEETTCYCERGYEWEDPSDDNNLNCTVVTPSQETGMSALEIRAFNIIKSDLIRRGYNSMSSAVSNVKVVETNESQSAVIGQYDVGDVWDWIAWQDDIGDWRITYNTDGYDCQDLDKIPSRYDVFFNDQIYAFSPNQRYCYEW